MVVDTRETFEDYDIFESCLNILCHDRVFKVRKINDIDLLLRRLKRNQPSIVIARESNHFLLAQLLKSIDTDDNGDVVYYDAEFLIAGYNIVDGLQVFGIACNDHGVPASFKNFKVGMIGSGSDVLQPVVEKLYEDFSKNNTKKVKKEPIVASSGFLRRVVCQASCNDPFFGERVKGYHIGPASSADEIFEDEVSNIEKLNEEFYKRGMPAIIKNVENLNDALEKVVLEDGPLPPWISFKAWVDYLKLNGLKMQRQYVDGADFI
ncbi:OLC1v1004939C1 [Oldenlandia corymbosa var. corymbosa]|uniref:OLC1v1004939C1 n=1 Tax=Oldenlandia corymbosa var. corymbosa TaxID=529605 RepID=A0AAV1DGY4_OLDCO|nr:OLC1v1004939C1 [Oldenlandia corymbosa var. corymbosa]